MDCKNGRTYLYKLVFSYDYVEDEAKQMKNIFDHYIQKDAMALHYIWRSLGPEAPQ